MSEAVLYRKYRPKSFKEVLGDRHIVTVLEAAIKGRKIVHAYLFSGPRGTGKTSVARIFAAEVGCTEKDLYEIDAASNRGVEDIRQLREAVATLPFESPYKVYIIDEAHMLTKEAFNALLKTLEEPPAHVIFILATTEREKMPETIVSRCQVFTFKKPSREVLKQLIVSVSKNEGVALDAGAADLIALLGDGSFRDTHGILQKVITASADQKITAAEVESVTGAPRHALIREFIRGLSEKDLPKALETVDKALKGNIDLKIFLALVLNDIRTILLMRYAPEVAQTLLADRGEDDQKFFKAIAENKGAFVNSAVLSELLGAYEGVSRAHISQLPLEIALVRLLGKNG